MAGNSGIGADTGFARAQIDGLLAWWTLAGVDATITEESVNWLRPRSAPRPTVATGPAIGADGRAGDGYPDDLPAFLDYLATAPDLPESIWPGRRLLPAGPLEPRLMIVLPAPDPAAEGSEAPLRADALALLDGMTRAIGLSLDQCHIACLSLIAPPGGVIPAEMLDRLARRMRHHIALVAPRVLLLAGDQTSRALLPAGTGGAVENLPFVNHQGGMVQEASILHPRLMLGQPAAKAEAWRALRKLVGDWGQ